MYKILFALLSISMLVGLPSCGSKKQKTGRLPASEHTRSLHEEISAYESTVYDLETEKATEDVNISKF